MKTIPETSEPEDEDSIAPGTNTDQQTYQETDWPDASPIQIPRVSSSTAQPPEQGHNRRQAQHSTENVDIPELEENSEEEQFADFDSFMAHHNTHHACEHIQQEYFSHLQDLDDDHYYCYIVGLGLNCKFIDLLSKRSFIKFIEISLYLDCIVSEIICKQTDTLN